MGVPCGAEGEAPVKVAVQKQCARPGTWWLVHVAVEGTLWLPFLRSMLVPSPA